MDISSTARRSDLFKGLLIEFGHNYIPLLVFQKATTHRNRLSLSGSHTYGIYLNSGLSGLGSRRHGIVLMILSVSDDNYRPAVLALGAETPDGGVDGVTYSGSLNRYRLCGYVVQEHLGTHVVSGDRELDERAAGEDY